MGPLRQVPIHGFAGLIIEHSYHTLSLLLKRKPPPDGIRAISLTVRHILLSYLRQKYFRTISIQFKSYLASIQWMLYLWFQTLTLFTFSTADRKFYDLIYIWIDSICIYAYVVG